MAVELKRVKVNGVVVKSGEDDDQPPKFFRVLRVRKRKKKLLVVDQEGQQLEGFACEFDGFYTREQALAFKLHWRI